MAEDQARWVEQLDQARLHLKQGIDDADTNAISCARCKKSTDSLRLNPQR